MKCKANAADGLFALDAVREWSLHFQFRCSLARIPSKEGPASTR